MLSPNMSLGGAANSPVLDAAREPAVPSPAGWTCSGGIAPFGMFL
jgi:hypothetical protein